VKGLFPASHATAEKRCVRVSDVVEIFSLDIR
jgi:hypothetical protein